jgi:starch synthase
MSTDTVKSESVRFHIVVNGPAYRSLANYLRRGRKASRIPRDEISAEIEYNVSSQQFALCSLDKHVLPQTLLVEPGSTTHKSLTNLLAQCAYRSERAEFTKLLHDIIASTPKLSAESLRILQRDITVTEKALRLSPDRSYQLDQPLAPSLSLDLDESPTLVFPEQPLGETEAAIARLSKRARLQGLKTIRVEENEVTVEVQVRLPRISGAQVEIFLHWGSYDEFASPWRDELIERVDLSKAGLRLYTHSFRVPCRGHHGATIFLQIEGDPTRIWLGDLWSRDAKFWISRDDAALAYQREILLEQKRLGAVEAIAQALRNNDPVGPVIEHVSAETPFTGTGRLLSDAVASLSDETSLIEKLARDPSLTHVLQNYGVGEVVFTTPEGPHAAAGGLAQVIAGLPPELSKVGLPISIISPLYAFSNGGKHTSAKQLLEKGFTFANQTAIPTYLGSVDVHLGPTYYAGTSAHRRAPSTIPLAVYLAEFKAVRFFLLANASLFDRLYQPVFADEQLRRAVVFSRATLEVIATSHFGIRPSALISNDWMTACVPSFAALDPRYNDVPWLRTCKTIHMIHNGGADYHGRLPINVNHEDLWPMLNLAPEHFFGFRDPHRHDLVNFTMAAAHHATGGILTVSKPYADQLVAPHGGDGLEQVLCHKRDAVQGISNGINRDEIDRYIAHLAGRNNESRLQVDELIDAKGRIKNALQMHYGLAPQAGARVISCVGRMVEQKGLSLLSGYVAHRNHSMLEEILLRFPEVQLLFAGPLTPGDRCASNFAAAVGYLTAKYPGRVAAHFDYVPHAEALRIMVGSTFFLMPSRFEPGGITQLEALAAGTLVVGRNVGGISATIGNFDPVSLSGNGFLCNDYCPTGFANTTAWALEASRDEATYRVLVTNACQAKHSWSDRVPAYQALLRGIVMGRPTT